MIISPPTSVQQLSERAKALAGKTISQLAEQFEMPIPDDLKAKKGWQGQLIEQCLGADAGNLAQPDFSLLDIELKTLPIDYLGKVQESTYVCVLNMHNNLGLQWRESVTYHKLRHVLWVPIAKNICEPTRMSQIATPFFWQMDHIEEQVLKSDWENVMELLSLGKIHQVSAKMGQYLQVRPKAAHSRVLTKVTNEAGELDQTLPRGFYLRPQFTQNLLQQHLHF